MFYIFYVEIDRKFETVKSLIKDYMQINKIDHVKITEESDNELQIICNLFDLTISNNTNRIRFTSEDYNMNLTLSFWFEVYYCEDESSTKEMTKLIGYILKKALGDGIVLSNGDKPILQRRNGKIKVDDSKLHISKKFPHEYLGVSYIHKELEQV